MDIPEPLAGYLLAIQTTKGLSPEDAILELVKASMLAHNRRAALVREYQYAMEILGSSDELAFNRFVKDSKHGNTIVRPEHLSEMRTDNPTSSVLRQRIMEYLKAVKNGR